MALTQDLRSITLNASADLSASTNQFKFLKLTVTSSRATVDIATSATADIVIGVSQDYVASGAPMETGYSGVTKVIVGTGGITAGTLVTCGAAGSCVAAVSTNRVHGIALTTTVDTGIGEIFLLPNNNIIA